MIYDKIRTDNFFSNVTSSMIAPSSALCYLGYQNDLSGRISLKINDGNSINSISQEAKVANTVLASITNLNYQKGDIFYINNVTSGEYTIAISNLGGTQLKGKGILLYLNNVPVSTIINFGGEQIINTQNEQDANSYCAAFCNLNGNDTITCLSVWKTPGTVANTVLPPEEAPLTFLAKVDNSSIALGQVGSPDEIALQYSKNGGTWTSYSIGDVIELSSNQTVAFSGNNDHFSTNKYIYYKFAMTGQIEAYNNIQSLMNFNDSCTYACYACLFINCTSLLTPPQLPATTLAPYCYSDMFLGCSNLLTPPQLPATELAPFCYYDMFVYCYSLSTTPQLPATTLKQWCYSYMFTKCTSLTAAPQLPATTLADRCYGSMFRGCSSLVTSPQLPATTLYNYCYEGMFAGCSNLLSAPQLPASILTPSCYYGMFEDCAKISSINVGFTDWTDTATTSATYNWLKGVSNTGTFYKPYALSTVKDVSHIPTNWNVQLNETITEDDCLTFKSNGATTVVLSAVEIGENSVGLDPITLQYKKNNGEWTNYTINEAISLANGDEVRFSGANDHFSKRYGAHVGDRDNYQFITTGTGTLSACGNVMSLCNFDKVLKTDVQFASLFLGCKQLIDISQLQLPATILKTYGYMVMFNSCSNLTALPSALPATTLADGCYTFMFANCTSLSTVPQNFLPVTELKHRCYHAMFMNCVSLTDAPALPATMLSTWCYYGMFDGCTALTSAPSLPATTLANSCYRAMFYGCSNLSSIEVAFTDWTDTATTHATEDWVTNVAASGTFTCPAALDTTTRDGSHVPANWTIVNP